MMKYLLTVLLLLALQMGVPASPATPTRFPGTWVSAPLCSNQIEVLGRKIHIVWDESGQNPKVELEYRIRADSAGQQVPMLFYAYDLLVSNLDESKIFREDFQVWLDGKQVFLSDAPDSLKHLDGLAFAGFQDLFSFDPRTQKLVPVWAFRVLEGYDLYEEHSFDEMRFFVNDLGLGTHQVRVECSLLPWKDRHGYVAEMSYYIFGEPDSSQRFPDNTEIWSDARALRQHLYTNLAAPDSGSLGSQAYWKLEHFPAEWIRFEFSPERSGLTKALIWIGLKGFLGIGTVIGLLAHFILLRRGRRKGDRSWISGELLLGSILAPLFAIGLAAMTDTIIFSTISQEFRGIGQGTRFATVLFPLVLPFYLVAMAVVDLLLRWWCRPRSVERSG